MDCQNKITPPTSHQQHVANKRGHSDPISGGRKHNGKKRSKSLLFSYSIMFYIWKMTAYFKQHILSGGPRAEKDMRGRFRQENISLEGVMINSLPAANSKPFITVKTNAQTHAHSTTGIHSHTVRHATAANKHGVKTRPQRLMHIQTHTNADPPKDGCYSSLIFHSQSAFGRPSPPTVSPLSWNKN